MAGDLLSIGKSGLFAAQVGLSTTGHNIANANVPGYSRQVVMQQTGPSQGTGIGFVGSGTEITDIKRYSNEFLNSQVRSAQAATSAFGIHEAQMRQIDNVLADTAGGLAPALQEFFAGVQDVASNPTSAASRQAMLSSADSLASRFQSLDARLQSVRDTVNGQIAAGVSVVNSYAMQIADLNNRIGEFTSTIGKAPNDLLDQRDQLILDLNKQIKASVAPSENNMVTVSIGTGQPLVVGKKAYALTATTSDTDPMQLHVGLVNGRGVTILSDKAMSGGGELGALIEFRTESLDRAQNTLGKIAVGLSQTFNAQHSLGVDMTGAPGGNFFKDLPAYVSESTENEGFGVVTAKVTDPNKLVLSDYRVQFDGANYVVTRLTDNEAFTVNPLPKPAVTEIDGVSMTLNGDPIAGDNFLVRPTIQAAALFSVAITDRNKVAAGAPVITGAATTNVGTGKIDAGSVTRDYLSSPLAAPVTLTFDAATNSFTGGPAGPIAYEAGKEITFGGISFTISGTPSDLDKFTLSPNIDGNSDGDNRNMRILAQLQTKNTLDGGGTTFQGAFAELVSYVGNKTREVQVGSEASKAILVEAHNAQQEVAGVNLDEEAANLLRYQQAYQAAGKMMQIASTLFDTLLSLGR